MRHLPLIALGALLFAGCATPPVAEPAAPVEAAVVAPATDAFIHTDYASFTNWLCHPGSKADACHPDLDATIINEDGSTSVEKFTHAAEPAFDCFYIYPTVSLDPSWNSDLVAGEEEVRVAANQFARYGSVCRLYAPMYRQRTILELQTLLMTGKSNADEAMRWADVVDSWNEYLKTDNQGRPVLIVGHSQGADMALQLVKKEIIGKPVQQQIVGVHAVGFTAHADADGTFGGMKICSSADEAGCLVNYESFRATAEPPASSRFGKDAGGAKAICNSPPALLEAGRTGLDTYMPSDSASGTVDYGAAVSTPFIKLPGLLSAECRTNATHGWLAVSVNAGAGPRADNVPGDVMFNGQVVADWGLHLIDMNIAMGDLVAVADRQAKALAAE